MATGLSRVSLTHGAAWRLRKPIISSGRAVGFSGKHIVTPRDCGASQPCSEPPPPHSGRSISPTQASRCSCSRAPAPHDGFLITLTGNLTSAVCALSEGCCCPLSVTCIPEREARVVSILAPVRTVARAHLRRRYWRHCSLAGDRNTKQIRQPAKSRIIFRHLVIIYCCEHGRAHVHTSACVI